MSADGTTPKDWKSFKKAFYLQFMPKQFKDHVMLSWDSLHMDEKDTIEDYNTKFWDAYLLVAPFKKIFKKNQIRK